MFGEEQAGGFCDPAQTRPQMDLRAAPGPLRRGRTSAGNTQTHDEVSAINTLGGVS